MQTKKTTMLAAGLVVAIVALAGVGYAALTDYTATTTNDTNSMKATYIKLSQTSSDQENPGDYSHNFLADLKFDTVNSGNAQTFTYALHATGKYDTSSKVYTPGAEADPESNTEQAAALISHDLTLAIDATNTNANDKGTLKVTVSNSNALTTPLDLTGTGLTYVMIVSNGTNYTQASNYTDNAWTFANVPVDVDGNFSVKLVVYASSAVTGVTGFADGTNSITSVFKFVLSTPVA